MTCRFIAVAASLLLWNASRTAAFSAEEFEDKLLTTPATPE